MRLINVTRERLSALRMTDCDMREFVECALRVTPLELTFDLDGACYQRLLTRHGLDSGHVGQTPAAVPERTSAVLPDRVPNEEPSKPSAPSRCGRCGGRRIIA